MALAKFFQKLAELNTYFGTAVPYINTNRSRLNVSTPNNDALQLLYTDPATGNGWIEVYPLTTNRATSTGTLRDKRDNLRTAIVAKMREIYADMPESVLTEDDRNSLRIFERDTTPTEIQAVDFAPVLSFEKVSNGIQIVRFQNPETPDSNAMPPSQGAEVQRFVGDAGLEENDVPFAHFKDTGKHLLQVDYDPSDKGKTAYYRSRYETATGKTGPWSDMQSEIVL